jgi:hypothetical protein
MTLYEKDDVDWYLVQLKTGEIGLAPSNYIKEVCMRRSIGNKDGPSCRTGTDSLYSI